MNNLPQALASESYVKTRRKTSSFKRPISYCSNDSIKKENKGFFFGLKKGSSNSKLNENVDQVDISKLCGKEKKAVKEKETKRIQGRKFNSDDEDGDLSNEETSVTRMAKYFENHNQVLNNPALLGYLLRYLEIHSMDYYSLLYYLIVQHYKSTVQLKDFKGEASRFATEIITTFIHDKSNLKLIHKIDTATILEDLRTNNNLVNIFDKSQEDIYQYCIKNNIDKVQQSIKHGLFTLEFPIEAFNFDAKMNFLNKCINNIVKNLEDKMIHDSSNYGTKDMKETEEYMADTIISVKTALATIYHYYSKKEKDDNADTVSLRSNKPSRASMLMRSTENLLTMNNCVIDKYPIFCSKIHKNKQGYSIFKKQKDIKLKGHNFQEYIFKYPVECFCCTKLLWGINPQGLCCTHCQEAIHVNCKDHVFKNCSKDIKKVPTNLSNTSSLNEDQTKKNSNDDTISISSQVSFNSNENELRNRQRVELTYNDEKQLELSNMKEISQSNCDLTSIKHHSGLVESHLNINNKKRIDYSLSDIQHKDDYHSMEKNYKDYLMPIRYLQKGHVKDIVSKMDSSTVSRSHSDDNMRSQTKNLKPRIESVYVPDLIVDLHPWTNDPDMNIEETFDANKELESFPEHISSDNNVAEYTRLLVLMEFHHKIKFTIMTLKRFDYLLIKQWPPEDTVVRKSLCLDSITPLYELIKTLNISIQKSTQPNSYSGNMARDVLDWLVLDNEANLELWLKYSIDLCCTNSLNLVKNSLKELRTDSIYSQVLTKRYNKMIMVEQLSNMRPLLFNLPLIVSKILKDLSKFSDFKEEIKLWKVILEKFKKLPLFIDENCIPLVQLVNNSIILNSMDRNSWLMKLEQKDSKDQKELYYDYILDFPKTIFHYKLFDFQEIKITSFEEINKTKNHVVFVKEVTDAYAICYENMIVLLQKENEKYYLKQFKSSDTSKKNPILNLNNVHVMKGDEKGVLFDLTLICIDVALLAQISFSNKDVWNRWYDFIYRAIKNKKINKKSGSEFISDNIFETNQEFTETLEINNDSHSEIKDKLDEFYQFHTSFFKEHNNLKDICESSVLFQKPKDSNEVIIGTSFDALHILKICYNNLSITSNDTIENLHSLILNMESRITSFMKSNSKDILNDDDIECVITDIQKEEIPFPLLLNSPPESPKNESCNYSGDDYIFQSQFSSMEQDKTCEIIYANSSNENEKQHEINESNDDENILKFVDEFIKQILEDTQLMINNMSSNNLNQSEYIKDSSVTQASSLICEQSN